jgi:hypothetical protein
VVAGIFYHNARRSASLILHVRVMFPFFLNKCLPRQVVNSKRCDWVSKASLYYKGFCSILSYSTFNVNIITSLLLFHCVYILSEIFDISADFISDRITCISEF